MHLKQLGYPIANDVTYGGDLYNGIDLDSSLFSREYDGEKGEDNVEKRMFMMLWLHAYKYKVGDQTYKTKVPEWADDKTFKCDKVF